MRTNHIFVAVLILLLGMCLYSNFIEKEGFDNEVKTDPSQSTSPTTTTEDATTSASVKAGNKCNEYKMGNQPFCSTTYPMEKKSICSDLNPDRNGNPCPRNNFITCPKENQKFNGNNRTCA